MTDLLLLIRFFYYSDQAFSKCRPYTGHRNVSTCPDQLKEDKRKEYFISEQQYFATFLSDTGKIAMFNRLQRNFCPGVYGKKRIGCFNKKRRSLRLLLQVD